MDILSSQAGTSGTKLITLQEIAARCGCSVKMLRQAIADGSLDAVKLGKRKPGTLKDTRPIRVSEAALAAWLEPIGGAK